MGVVYGLAAAVCWGTADFLARLASTRVGSRRTLFFMQASALALTSVMVAIPGARAPHPTAKVLAIAVGIGALNVTGGGLLYRALEVGTVALVSPVSSTFAAISALLAITVASERPTLLELGGLLLCAVGVAWVSVPPGRSSGPAPSRRGLGMACGAALCWGISFFAVRDVVGPLGPYVTVWISRITSVLLLAALALWQRTPLALPRGAWGFIVGIAAFDSTAFVFFNLGVAGQLTSVVSIISSLFAAVTVLLAMVFLGERLSRPQWAAVGVILAGVALVSSAG